MPLNYDPVSALVWAFGHIAVNATIYAVILFPFAFAALWSLKRLAQLIFPAPKTMD
jgi:uncharacterized membrane protein